MSGGGRDASTICICHRDGERVVADVVRGRYGDPNAAALDYAALAKQYRCRSITGDRYGGEWVAGAFRRANVDYRQSPLVRSDLYLEGQVQFTRGVVSIPANAVLLKELRQLERRVARSGRDSVNHGLGQHDDHSNALFGSLYLCAKAAAQRTKPKFVEPGVYSNGRWWGDGQANTPAPAGYRPGNEPWRAYVGSYDPFAREW
jgi:hypothetical protein